MAINLNNTTPAAPGGNQNVTFQQDGAGNVSAYVPLGVFSINSQTGILEFIAGSGIGLAVGSGIFDITNTGVLSINSQTGVLEFIAGNGISLAVGSGIFDITNTGVLSINSQTGPVSIVGGTGISVATGSDVITISSTASGIGGVLKETSNYNAASGDSGKLISFNTSSAVSYTLLATPSSSTWFVFVKNIGTGALTINPNGLTIDGSSSNMTLYQGDSVMISTDGTNYFTGMPRTISVVAFAPSTLGNSQIMGYFKMDRPCVFPASAPNSYAVASVAATGSTTITIYKNGSSFATVVFSASGTTGAFTQSSSTSFAAGDILEIQGPSSADATLANIGITLQGYRY